MAITTNQKSHHIPKKDLVAQIAYVNHLNRTIMYLVHTNQSYDYQQAVGQ